MNFYIKQKVFSLKDHFNIFDDQQKVKYQVQGKFMSLSNKLAFTNENGETLLRAQRQILSLFPKYFIYDPSGAEIATIKRNFSFRPNFSVMIKDRPYEVSGSFFAHSFTISRDGMIVASIQKRIISWGDTYEIIIDQSNDIELLLFIVIVLDQVVHENNR